MENMKNVVLRSGSEVYGEKNHEIEETYYSSIIEESSDHRYGGAISQDNLLAENRDFGGA